MRKKKHGNQTPLHHIAQMEHDEREQDRKRLGKLRGQPIDKGRPYEQTTNSRRKGKRYIANRYSSRGDQ